MMSLDYESLKDKNWLYRAQEGHTVFLAKEREIAVINWEFTPPKPGHNAGKIGIRRYDNTNRYTGDQTWYISSSGTGIDGSQLFIPIAGQLSDSVPELPSEDIRLIHRHLDLLSKRVQFLEQIFAAQIAQAEFDSDIIKDIEIIRSIKN